MIQRQNIAGVNFVRDDLFPSFYGGNKARKISCLLKHINSQSVNAIVTTGGVQSNHCRVVALACAQKGWKCKLILHGSKIQFENENGNAFLMRLAGADVSFVESQEIGPAMDKAMIDLSEKGYNPYYLYGGGHNKYGVQAYEDAVQELHLSIKPNEIPNHIFLASGTGSTQAGILIGLEKVGWNSTQVHGISVARNNARGKDGVLEAIHFINTDFDASRILFYDDFLFGGYGHYNEELKIFTYDIARKTGILLDTTYTGKAYYGMLQLIRKHNLKGNILFWHTGGLLNLMA